MTGEFVPVALLLLASLLFFLSYFNRFAGLRSGAGEFGGGIAILQHRLPYRDYYTAGPPLNQIKAALELGLFGKMLFVSRLAGVIERLFIAGLLYAWLRRTFSQRAAMLASLVAIIVSAGDRTDPVASYNHDAILLAMICGFAASTSLEAATLRRLLGLAALAGGAAGLSILTKQTVGLGAAVSVLVFGLIAIWRLRNVRRAAMWGGAYVAGIALPVLMLAIVLARLGVLRDCLTMLFVSGPAAKASGPMVFLSREWTVAIGNIVWLSLAFLATALSAGAVWRATRKKESDESLSWSAIGLGCFVVIGVAEVLALTSLPALQDFSKSSIYFVLIGSTGLGIGALFLALRSRTEGVHRGFQIALFAALSWSVAVTLSLSWPAFEAMTLPGLGLLLAVCFDGTRPWGRRFLCLVMGAMVFLQVREKLDLPFAFDRQEEPAVRFATHRSSQAMLWGMRLPAEEVRLLDDVTAAARIAKAHGVSSGFTYPEMSLIYPLADLQYPTRAGSHNIDVVKDSFAREEAARLLLSKPGVILYARPSEADMEADEAIWRGGRPSGQRAIVGALDQLVAGYHIAGIYRLTPSDTPIRLYVRYWDRTNQ